MDLVYDRMFLGGKQTLKLEDAFHCNDDVNKDINSKMKMGS